MPFESDFINSFLPDKPLRCEVKTRSGEHVSIRRVVGYREIFLKRKRMEYLVALEEEEICGIAMPDEPFEAAGKVFFEHPLVAPGGGTQKKDNKDNKNNAKKDNKDNKKYAKKDKGGKHDKDRKKTDGSKNTPKSGHQNKIKSITAPLPAEKPKTLMEKLLDYFKIKNSQNTADGAKPATQSVTHIGHPGHPDHPGHAGHTGHADHPGHAGHTGHPGHPDHSTGVRKSFGPGRRSTGKPLTIWQKLFGKKNKVEPMKRKSEPKTKKRKRKAKPWYHVLVKLFKNVKDSDDESDEERIHTIIAKGGDNFELDENFESHWLSLSDTDENDKENEIESFNKPLKPWYKMNSEIIIF